MAWCILAHPRGIAHYLKKIGIGMMQEQVRIQSKEQAMNLCLQLS